MILAAKRKKLCAFLVVAVVVLICAAVVIVQMNKLPPRVSAQSDYPVLSTPAQADFITVDLKSLTTEADLVFVGTVKKVSGAEEHQYTPKKGTADYEIWHKSGISVVHYQTKTITLEINEIYKGKEIHKEIKMVIGPAMIDCSPDFKTGQKMIFFLTHNSVDNNYDELGINQCFYYIASDSRVYPAAVFKENKDTSGMALRDFKAKVKSYVR